jgi:VWFA-related protein
MNGAVACFSLLLSATPIQQERPLTPPVFGVEVENVYIDAFVTVRGTPLQGLTAKDFELRDNGVVQSLEIAASEAQPLLAVLALDTSGSLDGGKIGALRAASQVLLDSLRPEDEATLFTFADGIQWLAPPSTDKTAVGRALTKVQPGGGTAILDALYAALLLPRARGRTLVVLFTDGADNLSWVDRKRMQVIAERSNAVIHVVSLGLPGELVKTSRPEVYPGEGGPSIAESTRAVEFENTWALRTIAEATGGRFWQAESLDRLRPAFAAIAEAMGKRYVLRYAPENVKRAGWHKIELRLKGKKGEVRTRNGYWVGGK